MTTPLQFCLVLHNHQPVGNFDFVYEQAYADSYLPFLESFEPFHRLRLSLHISGPLAEWLDQHHPEYLDRLKPLVQAGRIEILGGAFYEPILPMIPSNDRRGQIQSYTNWLERRLGANIGGMWVPERVWEPSLITDLVESGISYTVLDDFHFQVAGIETQNLDGYWLSENQGQLLKIFPGSEPLRYFIPFSEPNETRDYLHQIQSRRPGSVAVFADDGEKFGTWPQTKQHVYGDGWLQRFLQMLDENRDWLSTATLADAAESTAAIDRVFLPAASYREMTRWALPFERQATLQEFQETLEEDHPCEDYESFIQGSPWKNFLIKYPESNEMYARMMEISRRCQELESLYPGAVGSARQSLYRGQCNCSYWHGAFGGIYLPHLRQAVYSHLIEAENLLDLAQGRVGPRVDVTFADYNLDSRNEIKIATDQLCGYFDPANGGSLYELDVRSIRHNLMATLARRPELYHERVLEGPSDELDDVASIHDLVVFKQAGLDRHLQYDRHLRKSLIDHFFVAEEVSPERLSAMTFRELGDFVSNPYHSSIHEDPERIQARFLRHGTVDGCPISVTKGVTMSAGSSLLEVTYLLEGLPRDSNWEFAVEWNFSGMPSGADDRFFTDDGGTSLGQLGTPLDLHQSLGLSLVDDWLGLRATFRMNRPSGFWSFPVETVSQSEGGFELVHQSVVVMPHWILTPDDQGRWSVTFQLETATPRVESDSIDSKNLAATEVVSE